jgi:enediyne biosynthesis protein E4
VGGGILDGKKMWSVSAAWVDYNNDGLLDLFVSNYCKWEVNKDPFCGPKPELRAYCHPNNYANLPNTLYRNNGDGTFTDVSAETGIAKYAGKGMGVAIADYDGDGFMDIFVANDNRPNFLFHNLGGKKFEEVALESGVAYTQSGSAISGMGADFKDVDNDGRPGHLAHRRGERVLSVVSKPRGRPVLGENLASAPAGNARHVRMGKWNFRFR